MKTQMAHNHLYMRTDGRMSLRPDRQTDAHTDGRTDGRIETQAQAYVHNRRTGEPTKGYFLGILFCYKSFWVYQARIVFIP